MVNAMNAYVTYIVSDSELSAILYTMLMNSGKANNLVITSMDVVGILGDLLWWGVLDVEWDGATVSLGRKAEKLWWKLDNDKFLHISIPVE